MSDTAFDGERRRRPARMRVEDGVDILPIEGDLAFKPEPDPPMDAIAAPVPQASIVTTAPPVGWYPPETAPDDGKPVWLMGPDDVVVEAVWRHTRVFDRMGGGKWREVGFWALRFSGVIRVAFEPLCWRPA